MLTIVLLVVLLCLLIFYYNYSNQDKNEYMTNTSETPSTDSINNTLRLLSTIYFYENEMVTDKHTTNILNTYGDNMLMPSGSICIWLSKNIPNGWLLCDGTNGTPDLRGRYVIGYDTSSATSSGRTFKSINSSKILLSLENMPPHEHHYVSYDARIDGKPDNTDKNAGQAFTQCKRFSTTDKELFAMKYNGGYGDPIMIDDPSKEAENKKARNEGRMADVVKIPSPLNRGKASEPFELSPSYITVYFIMKQ